MSQLLKFKKFSGILLNCRGRGALGGCVREGNGNGNERLNQKCGSRRAAESAEKTFFAVTS
jgi:hypothetical protein